MIKFGEKKHDIPLPDKNQVSVGLYVKEERLRFGLTAEDRYRVFQQQNKVSVATRRSFFIEDIIVIFKKQINRVGRTYQATAIGYKEGACVFQRLF